MRIGLLVNDGCFASGVAALLDVLGTADVVRASVDPSIPPLETVLAGPKRTVHLGSGLSVQTQRTLAELDDVDIVVVPAMGTMTGPATEAALESRTGRSVVRALRSVDPDRVRFAAACTGVFPLAASGLADGRHVTTTWFL